MIEKNERLEDPVWKFPAKAARKKLAERKKKEEEDDNWKLLTGVSKSEYRMILDGIISSIKRTCNYSDDQSVEIYLCGIIKEYSIDFLAENGDKLMRAVMSDFKNNGYDFEWQFVQGHPASDEVTGSRLEILMRISWEEK